jgi:hypothetical protein
MEIVRDATSSGYSSRWRQFTANSVGSEEVRAMKVDAGYRFGDVAADVERTI